MAGPPISSVFSSARTALELAAEVCRSSSAIPRATIRCRRMCLDAFSGSNIKPDAAATMDGPSRVGRALSVRILVIVRLSQPVPTIPSLRLPFGVLIWETVRRDLLSETCKNQSMYDLTAAIGLGSGVRVSADCLGHDFPSRVRDCDVIVRLPFAASDSDHLKLVAPKRRNDRTPNAVHALWNSPLGASQEETEWGFVEPRATNSAGEFQPSTATVKTALLLTEAQ